MTDYPAPWQLTGKGYIILYRFNKSFAEKSIQLPDFLQEQFCGGFGSIMLVDYQASNAGPYSELLLIPGKFHHRGTKRYTISNIYVSTMESMISGRQNWGIPKELASFQFRPISKNREMISVFNEEEQIADFTIRTYGPSFPVNTALLPFPLVQLYENQLYYTQFSGKGKGRLAKLEGKYMNGNLFPDAGGLKPWAVIKLDPFKITFPVPHIDRLD